VKEDTRGVESGESTVSTVSGGVVTTLSEEKTVSTRAESEGTAVESGADVKARLKDLFSNAAREYMAVYETTFSGGGQPDYATQMAYYVKGGDKVRIDIKSADSEAGESQMYLTGKTFVMCNKQEGTWNCMKMPQNAQFSQDPGKQAADIKEGIDAGDITQLPGRVVAGVNARCYRLVVSGGAADNVSPWESTYCVSPEGILLYSDTTEGDMHMTQEAVSYKTSVEDSAFVPPAQPTDMSFSSPAMAGD